MPCPYSHITPQTCLSCKLPHCDGGNHKHQTSEETCYLAAVGLGQGSVRRRPPVIPPRVCPVCGKQFVPRSTRQVYCSKHCQYIARWKRDKEKAAAKAATPTTEQEK